MDRMGAQKPVRLAIPNLLAPGTGFLEDSFSTDQWTGDGFSMIQAYYIYFALYF